MTRWLLTILCTTLLILGCAEGDARTDTTSAAETSTTARVHDAVPKPDTIAAVKGSWVNSASPITETLTIDDNRVGGEDSCNGYSGEWTLDEDGYIVIGRLPITTVGCPGPEGSIHTSVSRTVSWRVNDDDQLELIDETGTVLETLDRA